MRKESARKLALISSVPALVLGYWIVDRDISLFGIGLHRLFLFHSALFAFLAHILLRERRESPLAFLKNAATLGFSAGIGIHLLVDIFQPKSVHFIVVATLVKGTLIDDTIWLGLNSLAAFFLAYTSIRMIGENAIDVRRIKRKKRRA